MMKKYFVLIFIFFITTNIALSQKLINVFGHIYDENSKESLYNAIVSTKGGNNSVYTDNSGFYNIILNKDSVYLITFYYIGYRDTTIEITTDSKIQLPINIGLEQSIVHLKEISIIERFNNNEAIKLKTDQIIKMPTLGGVPDVMKVLQFNTGIKQCKEGSAEMSVRGGSPEQNLILIDEVPLYYLNHLGGFVSIFDANAINDFEVWKGGFPAKYGGRLSSIIDVHLKNGNPDSTKYSYSVSPLLATFYMNGPIQKDKTTFLLSVRKCYFDWLSVPFTRIAIHGVSLGYSFYDINFKINHNISKKTSLTFLVYGGDDNITVKIKQQIPENSDLKYDKSKSKNIWGNKLVSLRLKHTLSSKVSFNSLAYWVNYKYKLINSENSETKDNNKYSNSNEFYSGVNDLGFKNKLIFYLNNSLNIEFGDELIYHAFNPGINTFENSLDTFNTNTTSKNSKYYSYENRFFASINYNFSNKLDVIACVNFPTYILKDITYFNPEPRVSLKYNVNEKLTLSCSYNHATQGVNLLTNSSFSTFPANTWVPSTINIKPQQCDQIYLGSKINLGKSNFDISTGVFYKNFKNQIEIKEGLSIIGSADNWEYLVEKNGTGKAYGFEFEISKKTEKYTTWLSYTYSRAFRKFNNINKGNTYPYKFDRPHELSWVFIKSIKENISFSSNFIVSSGNPYTLPYGMLYSVNNYDPFIVYANLPNNIHQPNAIEPNTYLYNSKNSDRLEIYHRLDIGIIWEKTKKKGVRTWSLSIYNVYNKKNPFFYDYKFDTEKQQFILRKVTIFPIIPSIAYSFKLN